MGSTTREGGRGGMFASTAVTCVGRKLRVLQPLMLHLCVVLITGYAGRVGTAFCTAK
jgi:hypothetical protein